MWRTLDKLIGSLSAGAPDPEPATFSDRRQHVLVEFVGPVFSRLAFDEAWIGRAARTDIMEDTMEALGEAYAAQDNGSDGITAELRGVQDQLQYASRLLGGNA